VRFYAIFISRRAIPTPFLCGDFHSADIPQRAGVMDFVFLGLIAALALASVGYLWLCDRLEERK
jgi:hypothetical protein